MLRRVFKLLPVALMIGIWFLLSKSGLVPSLYLPSPGKVLIALRDTKETITGHTWATLVRTISGFLLGVVLGILAGVAMSWNRLLFSVLDTIIESVRPVPPIAALPFFILWFGIGNFGQVLLITLACGVIIAVDTFVAIRNVAPIHIRAAASLGASKRKLYQTVILPAILPHLTSGLRIAAPLAFTIAIAAEFMGAQQGLGFMIMRARRTLETQTIFLAVLIIGAMAIILDRVIRVLMDRLTRWSEKSTEAIG
jgi:ABC-type nitrate/sulfonate/bicarbonate transport system permease component